MNHVLIFRLLFVALCLYISGCKKSDYGSEYFKLKHDGKNRQYLVHKPDNFDSQAAKSLVIALHGGLGTPKNIEEQSLLSELSDEEGFLVCYPEGTGRTWNGGGCCGKAQRKEVDDVGFLSELIDELVSEYSVDANRVYVTGMSNGAFMSYRLACELPEKIAAIAPVAGTMDVESCNSSSPVAIIHFHSYQDTSIPYEGGVGNGVSNHYNPPLDSIFSVWNSINGCLVSDSITYSGTDFDVSYWGTCNDSVEMFRYITHDGGHSWPMGTQPRGTADEVSSAIDASRLMWEFFQDHPKR